MGNYLIRSFNPLAFVACLFILVTAGMSCSGGGNPAIPGSGVQTGSLLTPVNERNARTPESVANHTVWGTYTMVFDQDAKTIEVLDNRELAMHLNVKGILQNPWWCPAKNCIQIQFLKMDTVNNLYTIKGTLVNPTQFNGFDVRAIIFLDEKGHQLLNADDYTMLYETGTDINPFRSYAKTVDLRNFSSYSSFSEIFEMFVPPVPKKFMIDFALDASWPDNCKDPYDLEEFGFEGEIYPDDPGLDGIDQGEGTIFTRVFDWQDNVSEVTVDATPITGGITTLVYNIDTGRWEATISDLLDTIPGDYICLIAAFSSDEPTIGLYNYVTIHVSETPPPAVQTIFGHVGDSFFMYNLDNAVVSVVNQDPLGFQPPPTTVVDGEYLVNVVTGTYDISVVMDDGVHLPQVAGDVIVTTNEDVHLNFGLIDTNQVDPNDPYPYGYPGWPVIMGCAGRVVDASGMPISGASIEFSSPDNWQFEGQEICQGDVTDEGGYFSSTNMPLMDEEYGNTITQFHMKVRADGYEPNDVGLFPAVANTVPYFVVALTPTGDTPIWTESFETDTGWACSGYYHRQLWNPSIFNISFLPQYQFCVMPPDEMHAGGLPKPVDGDYFLWYGVEADGNFLGQWDPGQGSWTGGMSLSANSGMATSPPIDLVGYTTARVEFDMSFDMESMDTPSFEHMHFLVNGASVYYFLPFIDPSTAAYSYSQRGHNRTMIWLHYIFDISSYAGSSVNLGFDFDTGDSAYNGFRGQCVDNIKVYAE